MRFYLDEDLSPQIAKLARVQGIDVLSSHECARNGLSDEIQLRLAATEGRCFVTRNARHLITLTTRFFESDKPHAGLLVVSRSIPGDRPAILAAALARYEQEHPDGVLPYSINYLCSG